MYDDDEKHCLVEKVRLSLQLLAENDSNFSSNILKELEEFALSKLHIKLEHLYYDKASQTMIEVPS